MANLNNELAKERNRAAAERTLMAWIRTCLSLISFGFGLDKIIAAIRSNASSGTGHAQLSVRLVAVSFVLTGILAMVARPATRASSWLVVALALICGGILGNLYDRLGIPGLAWHAPAARVGDHVYAVRDWIHVTVPGVIDWPIFNLADSWLVIGAGMLLVSSFLETPQPSAQAPQP